MTQKTLEQKIDRVLYILENDDKTDRKGLVKQVEDMEQALDEIILNQKMFAFKVAFLGALGGFLFTALVWIYDKIIIK
jgi:hypothetical protein